MQKQRKFMKRVAIGELSSWSRNRATEQLTKNLAVEKSRSSFVSARNCKGLRDGVRRIRWPRVRFAKKREREVFIPGVLLADNYLTLCSKTAIELTTRLA
jgi:hypothetical protein